MRNQRLQERITAGRFTLPIVNLTCIACWVLTSVLLPGLEVKESSLPAVEYREHTRMGQPHCQLFALCRYRLFPDRAEQYVCHHPHESIRTNLTLLSAHHGLPRHAPALCGRRRCCNLSHFALFPVQKLSAASSCRLSVPFVSLC